MLRESIRIKETGRYNQQMNPHAVLLEIGSDLNTQEEADYSMECFAQVVYEVLRNRADTVCKLHKRKGGDGTLLFIYMLYKKKSRKM